MGKKRVTLQTIADRIGVSRTTVSNAFSRPDQLSEELRDRVLGAARELGYAGPDPAARTLRAGSAEALGVVLPESLTYAFTDAHAIHLLNGLAQVTEPRALSLLLIPVPPTNMQEHAVRRAVADGFCIHSLPADNPVIEIALCRGVPVVFVDGPDLPDHPFIGIDEQAAARDITRHLLDSGRKRLAVISFRVSDDEATGEIDDERVARSVYRASSERIRGVLAAAADAGIARSDVRVIEAGRSLPDRGRAAAAMLLDGPQPPDAIVCLSDLLAAGAMAEVRYRGLTVGHEVAVTGWDDAGLAEELGLTTVRQADEEKGRIAARWLIEGVRGPERAILPTEIIVRASTAT